MTPPADHLRSAARLAFLGLTDPHAGTYNATVEHHLLRAAEQIGEPVPRLRQDLAALLRHGGARDADHAADMLATCVLGST